MQPFSPLIEQAAELAAQWHDGTYRKSRWRAAAFPVPEEASLRVPVIAHVTAVALLVQRAGWEDAVVAAAFLHDALEDPNRYGRYLSYEEMSVLIGEEVAALALAVTERKFDEAGNVRSWRARKEDYVAHLENAPTGAVAISLADKLHNLWSMNQALEQGESPFVAAPNRKVLSAGPGEQLWFHRAVLEASARHADPRLEPLRGGLAGEIQRFARLTATG